MIDDSTPPATEQVLSLVFPHPGDADPEVIFVAGPPGSGRSRVTGRLLAESPGCGVVRSEDLAALHPLSRHGGARSEGDLREIDRATAMWLQACLRHSRETGRSVILDAAFTDPGIIFQTADRFRFEGFRTRVVVTAVRRAESILAMVSEHLRATQRGQAPRPLDISTHDEVAAATLTIADDAVRMGIDRLNVVDRTGTVGYESQRDESKGTLSSGLVAFQAAQRLPLGTVRSALWLSELHRSTEFARSSNRPSRPVLEALIELHEVAAPQIVSELAVPEGAVVVSRQERSHAADADDLRRRLRPQAPSIDATTPIISTPAVGRSGIGR